MRNSEEDGGAAPAGGGFQHYRKETGLVSIRWKGIYLSIAVGGGLCTRSLNLYGGVYVYTCVRV